MKIGSIYGIPKVYQGVARSNRLPAVWPLNCAGSGADYGRSAGLYRLGGQNRGGALQKVVNHLRQSRHPPLPLTRNARAYEISMIRNPSRDTKQQSTHLWGTTDWSVDLADQSTVGDGIPKPVPKREFRNPDIISPEKRNVGNERNRQGSDACGTFNLR